MPVESIVGGYIAGQAQVFNREQAEKDRMELRDKVEREANLKRRELQLREGANRLNHANAGAQEQETLERKEFQAELTKNVGLQASVTAIEASFEKSSIQPLQQVYNNNPYVKQAFQAIGIQSAPQPLDFENDVDLLANIGIEDWELTDPESAPYIKENLFKVLKNGEWVVSSKMKLLQETGLANKISSDILKQQQSREAWWQQGRAGVEQAFAEEDQRIQAQLADNDTIRANNPASSGGGTGGERLEAQAIEARDELFAMAGGEENFAGFPFEDWNKPESEGGDPAKYAQFRSKLDDYMQKRKINIPAGIINTFSGVSTLIDLASGYSGSLADANTGRISTVLNQLDFFTGYTEDVGDKAYVAALFTTAFNLRARLDSGAAISVGELDRIEKAFGTLSLSTPALRGFMRAQYDRLAGELNALSKVSDYVVGTALFGESKRKLEVAVGNLEEIIKYTEDPVAYRRKAEAQESGGGFQKDNTSFLEEVINNPIALRKRHEFLKAGGNILEYPGDDNEN